jgi:hypothetical protein
MNNPPPLTDRQIRTIEALAKIKMAWVALWFALGFFAIALAAFLIALFTGKSVIATSITGIIDGILGWTLKTVYSYLFPSPSQTAATTSVAPKLPTRDPQALPPSRE